MTSSKVEVIRSRHGRPRDRTGPPRRAHVGGRTPPPLGRRPAGRAEGGPGGLLRPARVVGAAGPGRPPRARARRAASLRARLRIAGLVDRFESAGDPVEAPARIDLARPRTGPSATSSPHWGSRTSPRSTGRPPGSGRTSRRRVSVACSARRWPRHSVPPPMPRSGSTCSGAPGGSTGRSCAAACVSWPGSPSGGWTLTAWPRGTGPSRRRSWRPRCWGRPAATSSARWSSTAPARRRPCWPTYRRTPVPRPGPSAGWPPGRCSRSVTTTSPTGGRTP